MRRILGIVLLFGFSLLAWATPADDMISAAAKKSSVAESISYLTKNVGSLKNEADKKTVYAFLGAVQEQAGKFDDAKKSYAYGAGLSGPTNSERLAISAIRCALSSGDSESAESFLKSSVKNSKDANISALVKLYSEWVKLIRAKNEKETENAISRLKGFVGENSMKSVQPSVLLTLWHLTGDSSYSAKIKSQFPASPEARIVKGEIQILPTPYWFFVPRKGTAIPEVFQIEESAPAASEKTEAAKNSHEKIVRQQLGLFRDEENAKALVKKAKSKGFDAKITSEKRPSGTTYYIVVVDENKNKTIGDELRTAGFDCYPVFE